MSTFVASTERGTAAKSRSQTQTHMSDATAQTPAPLRANQELDKEKPSHASSLAEAPLAQRQPGFFSRRRILGPVVKDYGDYGLLACSMVTGMVDGASFLNWGVFVGMQTGECPQDRRCPSNRVSGRLRLLTSKLITAGEKYCRHHADHLQAIQSSLVCQPPVFLTCPMPGSPRWCQS